MKRTLLTAALLLTAIFATAQDHCKATTLKGQQCTRKAVINGYCKQHNPEATRCEGINKNGQHCHNLPAKDSKFCRMHKVN